MVSFNNTQSVLEKRHNQSMDFLRALTVIPAANKAWKNLTPIAQRDFITWIEGAKQQKTRISRIKKACSMLAAGKRRPCCYAMVPMDLYKALDASPSAKTFWKSLTPAKRRDIVDWINEVTEPKQHTTKVEKVCSMLLNNKLNI
jgi:uncharacterized protein YdeI (YjbR/CyaY-like superfamily)